MAIVNAITNGSGLRLFGGMDLHNLKSDVEYGKRIDPWERISHARLPRQYKIYEFFAEDSRGDLIHEHLSAYNLLIRHIIRELSPDDDTEVTILRNGSAKQIKIGADTFLIFQGKIYRK